MSQLVSLWCLRKTVRRRLQMALKVSRNDGTILKNNTFYRDTRRRAKSLKTFAYRIWEQEVASSNPAAPTNDFNGLAESAFSAGPARYAPGTPARRSEALKMAHQSRAVGQITPPSPHIERRGGHNGRWLEHERCSRGAYPGRFSPACAGNGSGSSRGAMPSPVQPRVCGER